LVVFFGGHTCIVFGTARWRIALQAALVPVSLGLIGASAFVLARAADKNLAAAAITITTVVVAIFTRISPLWLFAIAGLLGLTGWL
jgi:chromate transporter